MNIFYLDHDVRKSVSYLVDKHVVKMPLETVQILSSSCHIHGMPSPYKPTHLKHPCVLWAASSQNNYAWLLVYAKHIFAEYTRRYDRTHASEKHLDQLRRLDGVLVDVPFSLPPQCMPEHCRGSDTVEAYRRYYRTEKKHIHSWKTRCVPEWIAISKQDLYDRHQ